jgi:hypothetical protein
MAGLMQANHYDEKADVGEQVRNGVHLTLLDRRRPGASLIQFYYNSLYDPMHWHFHVLGKDFNANVSMKDERVSTRAT